MANIHDTTNFRALSFEADDFAPDPTVSAPPQFWRSLRHKSFLSLWIAALVSNVGTWVQNAAQAWMIYKLTNSSFFLGLDALLALAPMFLFIFPSGVLVDRCNRRKVLLYAQCLQYLCALILAALFFSGHVSLWHILVLSFVGGVGQAFANVAYVSLIPRYVPTRDLLNATALNSLQLSVARVVGPAVAGVTLHYLNPGVCYGFNALSFLCMIVIVWTLPEPHRPAPAKSVFAGMTKQLMPLNQAEPTFLQLVLKQVRQVKIYVSRRRGLLEICGLCFATTFLGSGVQTILPSFVRERLDGDATVFTALMTAYGVGTMASSLYVARRPKTTGNGRRIIWLLCLAGFSLIGLSQARLSVIGLGGAFCVGACLIGVLCQYTSLVQFGLADEVRGRVMSLFLFVFHGGFALGGFVAGAAAAALTASSALTAAGAALIVLGVVVRCAPMRIRDA
jgi:MFS family permease